MEIEKVLVLSTGHVTEREGRFLTEGNLSAEDSLANLSWDVLAYGWLVFVPEENPKGISEGLASSLDRARALDCPRIRFDCDGPAEEGIPVYAW